MPVATIVAEGTEVRAELEIAASPERIFAHLTDPEKIITWMGLKADLDPTPGGIYRVQITGTHTALGSFVEVTPFTRVVYTWGWESGETPPPGGSTIEITLHPQGETTLLRMIHSNASVDDAHGHHEGWSHYLPRLVAAAEGRDPGPDPWAEAS